MTTERKQPKEIADTAWDNGHVPVFLPALCELLMVSDPYPLDSKNEEIVKKQADYLSKKLGFTGWIEAYHGLCT